MNWEVLLVFLALYLLSGPVLGLIGLCRANSARTEVERLRAQLVRLKTAAPETRPISTVFYATPEGAETKAANEEPPKPQEAASEPQAKAPAAKSALPPDTMAPTTGKPASPARPASGWEQSITSRWMLWLGAVTLALGGAFLVKVTIDAGLLTPAVRTSLGIDWITTKFRFARYPNLQAGDYRFEVLALNEDKTISEKPATIYFSISPPWWQTWWFRTLSVLIIAGIISYFINARIQKQKRERAFLNQVNELKTQALRSQMNPHFIFNALNAIQKFLTINNREQAMIYLSRFGKLIRLIFEQSQKEKISLEEELEFLNLYLNLEKLRFMDKVDIQMKISPELLDVSDEISIPPLLIQPIIENSFKHGFLYKEEPGILKINFSKKDTFLICTIEDDGIGRKKAAELGQQELKDRPSSGLKTAQERLNIYSPVDQDRSIPQSEINVIDLNLENGEVSGTMVEVKIYCSDFEFIE